MCTHVGRDWSQCGFRKKPLQQAAPPGASKTGHLEKSESEEGGRQRKSPRVKEEGQLLPSDQLQSTWAACWIISSKGKASTTLRDEGNGNLLCSMCSKTSCGGSVEALDASSLYPALHDTQFPFIATNVEK